MMEKLALTALLVPFIGALLTACVPQRAARHLCTLFALLATLATVALGWMFLAGGKVAATWTLASYHGVALFGFTVDRISTLIVFAVVFLGFLVSLYSTGYLTTGNREHPHDGGNRYYAFLLIFIGAMAGLVLSSTLLGQLLFFEITGGCSWALIGYYQTPKSQRSAMKALLITHVASLGLYLAAATLFLNTGTFALSALSQLNGSASMVVYGGILFAAWGKSAQLPLQAWLPDAMEAPTPVSAYLHAASMVKVGVYIFARAILDGGNVPHVIGWVGVVMATITLIYGFMMYLPQKDMKRLLAWSTITQLAYIFLALSLAVLGSKEAFDGGIAYIFNHAFAKSLFFLVAGAFSYSCGTRLLPKLRGVMSKSPLLGIGFCVAALAIAGVPPFNGFFSKFPIFAAGFALSAHDWILAPIMVLVLIESVASFAWLIYWFGRVVPGEPSPEVAQMAPLPMAMRMVLVVLVVMSLCSSVIAALWLN
ncbi:hydrogenase 4 subunit D [Pluralibacter sp.]|uniref:hydrogenase 4 subunit D n=1 Tax=Pluralibacter sp. TaxID=1920032 RepID=UPI0025F0A830|nr:hydrogenase 4 subunit D [Pluralibacter sp.]